MLDVLIGRIKTQGALVPQQSLWRLFGLEIGIAQIIIQYGSFIPMLDNLLITIYRQFIIAVLIGCVSLLHQGIIH